MSDADLDTALKGAHADPEDLASAARQTSVYVYEAPVRIWHWINAAAILVLCVTGYLIGAPPPSMQIAEATHQFVFGFIRFAHFAAGWILAIGFLGRIYWAIFGNHHARQLFILPLWKRDFWREIWFEVKWYLFLEKEPKKYVGHNPLAQLSMFRVHHPGVQLMIFHRPCALFRGDWGWTARYMRGSAGFFTLLGPNPIVVHTCIILGDVGWIVIFLIVHIYVAIREISCSLAIIVSTMISGHAPSRTIRPDLRPSPGDGTRTAGPGPRRFSLVHHGFPVFPEKWKKSLSHGGWIRLIATFVEYPRSLRWLLKIMPQVYAENSCIHRITSALRSPHGGNRKPADHRGGCGGGATLAVQDPDPFVIGKRAWADERGSGVRCVRPVAQTSMSFDAYVDSARWRDPWLYLLSLPRKTGRHAAGLSTLVDYGLVPGTLKVVEDAEVCGLLGRQEDVAATLRGKKPRFQDCDRSTRSYGLLP